MAFGGFRGNRQSVIWKWQFTRKCLRKLPFNARVLGVNKKRTGDTAASYTHLTLPTNSLV